MQLFIVPLLVTAKGKLQHLITLIQHCIAKAAKVEEKYPNLSHYLHFVFIEQHAVDFLDGHVSRFLRLKVNKPIPFGLAVLIKDNLQGKGRRDERRGRS